MLYKLTWQTRFDEDEWGDPQFVIGNIGSVHKCYNALILCHTPRDGNRRAASVRAVVTALTSEIGNPQNIVYEWGWTLDAAVS